MRAAIDDPKILRALRLMAKACEPLERARTILYGARLILQKHPDFQRRGALANWIVQCIDCALDDTGVDDAAYCVRSDARPERALEGLKQYRKDMLPKTKHAA